MSSTVETQNTATEEHWKERIELLGKLGQCVGALKVLRFQVDEACRARIDKLLEDVGAQSVPSGNAAPKHTRASSENSPASSPESNTN